MRRGVGPVLRPSRANRRTTVRHHDQLERVPVEGDLARAGCCCLRGVRSCSPATLAQCLCESLTASGCGRNGRDNSTIVRFLSSCHRRQKPGGQAASERGINRSRPAEFNIHNITLFQRHHGRLTVPRKLGDNSFNYSADARLSSPDKENLHAGQDAGANQVLRHCCSQRAWPAFDSGIVQAAAAPV